MNLKEIKSEFESELENGLDHAEWYEKEIKWLIEQAEKLDEIKTVFMTDEFTISAFIRTCMEIFKED